MTDSSLMNYENHKSPQPPFRKEGLGGFGKERE